MAAALARPRRPLALPYAEPNVIPFIDVLLVLLIIFMVTAPKPTTDLRLDLPRPGPSLPAPIQPTIVEIRAAPQGYRVFVGGEETTTSELSGDTLVHVLSTSSGLAVEDVYSEARVFVRSDLDVEYQDVIAVVETLQTEGFQQVAIYAQSADEDSVAP